MHGKAVEREQRLKEKLQAARAKLKELRQRLRERWARRRGSEKRTRSAGGTVSSAGQQAMAGASMHTCRCRSKHTTLSRSGAAARHAATSIARTAVRTAQLEIEVRAYRRVIKRRRYRRSCQCAAAPALLTAAAPPRLIPKGILGISVWVTVLIDKYLLYRPTYRLLADLRAHGLDLAQGTVTDGMRRLAPLFAPLREALIARSRTGQHWHADETRWQVFEANSEDACQPGPDPLGAGAEAAFRDRDRRRSERRPLFCVQAVGQGHRAGAVVLLGARAARLHHDSQRAGRSRGVGRAVACSSWTPICRLYGHPHLLAVAEQINGPDFVPWLTEYLNACAVAGGRVPAGAVPALEPARGARAARLARPGGRQPCRLRRCATADGCSASRSCS